MLYYIHVTTATGTLIWPSVTRSTGARIIKRILPDAESVAVSVNGASHHTVSYDPHFREWNVLKHANGRSLYYGPSYKTLSGALNKLDKLAETEMQLTSRG